MLLREDGHTRLTEKVTSEERPEAGEGVDQDGILASLKTERAESTKFPSLKQVTIFVENIERQGKGRAEARKAESVMRAWMLVALSIPVGPRLFSEWDRKPLRRFKQTWSNFLLADTFQVEYAP